MLGFLNHTVFATALTAIGLAIFYACLSSATRRSIGLRWAVGALALPVIGFMSPHILVMHLALLLFVPVLARSREDIAPLFFIAAFLLPSIQLPILMGSTYLLQFSTLTTIAIGGLIAMAMRPGKTPARIAMDLPFGLMLIVLIFIAARGQTPSNSLRLVITTALTLIPPYYVLSRTIRMPADIRRMMLSMAFVGVVCTPLLLFEAVRFWPMYFDMAHRYGISLPTVANIRAGFMRANGPQLQPTAQAFVNVACLLALYLSRPSFRSSAHWGAALFAVALGLLALQSRNAWIGMVLAIVVAETYRGRIGRVGGLAVVAGVAVLTFVSTVPLTGRLGETVGDASGTGDYRAQLLRRGLEELSKDRWFGAPSAILDVRLKDMIQGEGIIDYVNSYLYFALHSGLLGLMAFLLALVIPLFWLLTRRRQFRRSEEAMMPATFVFAGIIVTMQMLIFTSFAGGPLRTTLVLLAIAAGLLSLKDGALQGDVRRKMAPRARLAPAGRLPALRR